MNRKRITWIITGMLLFGGCLEMQATPQFNQKEIFTMRGAQYEGGMTAIMKELSEYIVYPEECKAEKIEGPVTLTFTVTKEGTIDGIRVVRSTHPLLEAEAIRVVKKLTKWIPAQDNGKAIDAEYSLPIVFRLPR